MKITIQKPVEVEVDAIRCVLPVRWGTEDMPDDYPHRTGNVWDVTIDLATGQIRDWPDGSEPLELEMKVCDSGRYYLMNGDEVVASIEEDYVPNCVIPGAWNDYVELDITASGHIANWKNVTAHSVVAAFWPKDD
jgi:hypothetical protein